MKKKMYKVRNKKTLKFETLGYNRKQTWLVYPSAAMAYSSDICRNPENYEVVVFEYVQTGIMPVDLKQLTVS